MIIKHFFKAHFKKTKKKGNCQFLTKVIAYLLWKKSSIATTWNPYFYCLGGLVFLTRWLHDILIYLLNYLSTDQVQLSSERSAETWKEGTHSFFSWSLRINRTRLIFLLLRIERMSAYFLLCLCLCHWCKPIFTAHNVLLCPSL